jgi:hypothetical protein
MNPESPSLAQRSHQNSKNHCGEPHHKHHTHQPSITSTGQNTCRQYDFQVQWLYYRTAEHVHKWTASGSQIFILCAHARKCVSQVCLKRCAGCTQVYAGHATGANSCKCVAGVSQVCLRCVSGVSQVYHNPTATLSQVDKHASNWVHTWFSNLIPFGKWSTGHWLSRNSNVVKFSNFNLFPSIWQDRKWFWWVNTSCSA